MIRIMGALWAMLGVGARGIAALAAGKLDPWGGVA
jgi:hypothetical protein